MNINEITLYENKTHRILKEGYQDLTESQIHYFGRFEKELWPLLEQYTKLAEAELTKDQINDIFKGAEQVAMDSGDNKTIAGKVGGAAAAAAKLPVDLAKKVDAKINELGRLAKDAGPVKNMDKKFNDLKLQIMDTKPDNKIVQGIVKLSDWAKANPGKASIAVGILTAMAAFAGGPAGGAAAGLILRSTNELLKGEDLSSAVGKSIKTAAYGAIAGWALDGIGDWLEGLRMDAVPYDKAPGLTTLEVGFKDTFEVPGYSSVRDLGSMVVPEDQVGEFQNLVKTLQDATAATGTSSSPAALDAFDDLWNFAKTFDKAEFLDNMNLQNDIAKNIALANDQFLQNLSNANDAIAAVAQGSIQSQGEQGAFKVGGDEVKPGDVTTSAAGNKKVAGVDGKATAVNPMDLKGRANIARKAGESIDIEAEFERYLAEAGLGDKIKGAAKKAAGAVGGAIKQGAKDIGNKVTANKLMKTWKSMGEPTDSASIMNILQDAGLTTDQISQIGQAANVPMDAKAASPEKPAASAQDTVQNKAQSGADAQDNAQPNAAQPKDTGSKSAISKGADSAVKPIKKGDTKEVNGKTYQWAGALWVDTATNKPVGIANAMNMGLGNPKLDPIIAAAKKDPALAKLIKQQVMSKGVKAGTAQAQQAAKAGVKGSEPVKTTAATNVKKAKAASKKPVPKANVA